MTIRSEKPAKSLLWHTVLGLGLGAVAALLVQLTFYRWVSAGPTGREEQLALQQASIARCERALADKNATLGQVDAPMPMFPRNGQRLIGRLVKFQWSAHSAVAGPRAVSVVVTSADPARPFEVRKSPGTDHDAWIDIELNAGDYYWQLLSGSPQPGLYSRLSIDPSPAARVARTSELHVGINVTGGSQFCDRVGDELVGIEPDIIRWFAQRLSIDGRSVKPVFHDMDFDRLLPTVAEGDLDAAIGQISSTEGRRSAYHVDFIPYYSTATRIVGVAGLCARPDPPRLRDMALAYRKGSVAEPIALELQDRYRAKILGVDEVEQILEGFTEGRYQFALLDQQMAGLHIGRYFEWCDFGANDLKTLKLVPKQAHGGA